MNEYTMVGADVGDQNRREAKSISRMMGKGTHRIIVV